MAPLAAALVVLGLVDSGQEAFTALLPGLSDFVTAGRELRFFNSFVTYLGMGLFHVAACCAVIALMAARISAFPPSARQRAWRVVAGILIVLAAMGALARVDGLDGGLNLAYRYTCAALVNGDLAAPVLPPDCFDGALSRFALMALIPLLSGILAASMAAAATSSIYLPAEEADRTDMEARLKQRSALMELAFQATACVMVTSILSQVMFYRLPLSILQDKGAVALMTGYAQSMALFWGVVFTLTLIAIFGPAAFILRQRLRDRDIEAVGSPLPPVLQPHTLRQQMIKALTALAPLLIGASGSIIETLAALL